MAPWTRINTAGILVAFMLKCSANIDRKTGGVRCIHLEARLTITGVSSCKVYAPTRVSIINKVVIYVTRELPSILQSAVMPILTTNNFAFINIITVSSISL